MYLAWAQGASMTGRIAAIYVDLLLMGNRSLANIQWGLLLPSRSESNFIHPLGGHIDIKGRWFPSQQPSSHGTQLMHITHRRQCATLLLIGGTLHIHSHMPASNSRSLSIILQAVHINVTCLSAAANQDTIWRTRSDTFYIDRSPWFSLIIIHNSNASVFDVKVCFYSLPIFPFYFRFRKQRPKS